MDDLHTDSNYSSEICQAIEEICFILNISYQKPPQRISHRWLTFYNCVGTLISKIYTIYSIYIFFGCNLIKLVLGKMNFKLFIINIFLLKMALIE